ncbi:MAG: Clp protease N-terminal domain-containing protein, partial [Bacteroidota bacterium]
MEQKFSQKVKEVIAYAREEALRLGHDYIGVEHLLLGLVRDEDDTASRILKSLEVDIVTLRRVLEDSIRDKAVHHAQEINNMPLTKQAEKVLKFALLEAKTMRNDTIGTEHLMLSILKVKDNIATEILNRLSVDHETFKAEFDFYNKDIRSDMTNDGGEEEAFEEEDRSKGSAKKPGASKSKTPVLDNFGRDITKMAEEGTLDPIVGRETEIERVSQI